MQHSKYNFFLALLSGCLLFCLAGCSTFQTLPKSYHKLTWSERSKQLNSIKEWSLEGSFSIQYAKNTNIASYQWQQRQDAYKISISSPLNLAHFDLYGNHKQVTLQESTYKFYTAKNPEKLLQQQIGWSLPISNLVFWIRGIPAPHSAYKLKLDQYRHLLSLKQQGWIIRYLDFTTLGDIDLPNKITLENPQFKIKITIKNWQITSTI